MELIREDAVKMTPSQDLKDWRGLVYESRTRRTTAFQLEMMAWVRFRGGMHGEERSAEHGPGLEDKGQLLVHNRRQRPEV